MILPTEPSMLLERERERGREREREREGVCVCVSEGRREGGRGTDMG